MRVGMKRVFLIGGGILATLALGAAALVMVFGAPRGASASTTTLYVGASAGADTGCASPGYTSIQDAIDHAAAGDTVYLCASGSPYTQTADIAKSITLTGDHGVVMQAPATWPTQALPAEFAQNQLEAPNAIVFIWGRGTDATVKGITINGPFPGSAGCGTEIFGVLALDHATATITNNTISNISDPVNSGLLGCQHGLAVLVGAYFWYTVDSQGHLTGSAVINDAATATISGNTVWGYQKNGITAKGAGTAVSITNNTVNGSNRDANYSTIIAQNGIELAEGATGQIMRNTVTGNTYTGPYWASGSGIVVFGGCGWGYVVNAQVVGNTLVNNDVGVYAVNYADDCSSAPPVRTNIKVTNNSISNDAVTNVGSWALGSVTYHGYQAGIDEEGNNDKVINNTVSGAGYATLQAAGGPFVLAIDTISGPTTSPKVHANQLG